MTETEARIVNEFVAGADVPSIAARYSVSEEYVDHLIEQTHLDKPIKVKGKRDWSLNNWGNRLVYSILAGWLVWILAGKPPAGVFVGITVVLFILATGIVSTTRRR